MSRITQNLKVPLVKRQKLQKTLLLEKKILKNLRLYFSLFSEPLGLKINNKVITNKSFGT